MSIGILKFKLPEEQEEFDLAQHGWAYKAALEELDNWLRGKSKYEGQEEIKIEEVREKIFELKR